MSIDDYIYQFEEANLCCEISRVSAIHLTHFRTVLQNELQR